MQRRALLIFFPLLATTPWAFAGTSQAEQARIDRLIHYVKSRNDVQFLRNGNAYSSADAAYFLRSKLRQMGEDVTTARQFIELIASKSSTSGEAYLIRFADGRMEPSAKFLGDELARIDAGK